MEAYFTQESFDFLTALAKNNERTWFNERKQQYEDLIRTPALNFIEDMGNELPQISPYYRAIPKKVGGSLMRVYRDARFSKDKTPLKTHVGIRFRHELSKDMHAPMFYLHIEPGNCFVGAGIWRPESKELRKIRETIADSPSAWKKAMKGDAFLEQFIQSGDRLTNPPRGYSKEHPLIEDLKYKDYFAYSPLSEEQVMSENLLDEVVKRYKTASPLVKFLCYCLEVNY